MKFKLIIFIVFVVLFITIDLKKSKKIIPSSLPTLAIFSKEKTAGGHCSFEVHKK